MIKHSFWLLGLFAVPVWAADLAASLHWAQRVELGTAVSGIVQTVAVKPGDRVKKGQVLVSLDATAFSAQVAEGQASVAQAQEEEKDAKRNLDRVQELYNRTVIAATELEAAQLRHARAQAQLTAARARLAALNKQLRDTTVRAPFDGVVLKRQVEPGQAVASQLKPEPLIVLARTGEMVARGLVALPEVRTLKPGQAVEVEVEGRRYPGRVRLVGLEPVGPKGEYAIDVVFPVEDILRAGTPAVIRLP
ncbi:efflux RND transporter periplasmic adaptor subunit [Thiobacter aerophilum]|uniref:Efflux RND transporter periplasmic adaptor subunit n=1 Tax=Thiobacter aerophilum TaxID=3121275 RepID=A0ABV0EGV1_9BURK